MLHVDEGRLNEYLDRLERPAGAEGAAGAGGAGGADLGQIEQHLAECAECRARLEEARRVRERAAAILRGSGPGDVNAPPFEEILARRTARSRRRTVFRMNRLTAVGWAATIVFAVGVGWIARGSLDWREPVRQRESIPGVAPITVQAPAAEPAASAASEPMAARTGERREVEVDVASPSEPATESPVEGVSDLVAGAGAAEAEQAAVGPPAGEPAPEPQPGLEAVKAAAPEAAEAERLFRARDEAARRDAVAGVAAPEPAAPLVQAQQVEWTPATAEEAERALGRALLKVPDLPIRSIAVGAVANRPTVRVQHELPSGATLTLVEWRDLNYPAQPLAARQAPMMIAADSAVGRDAGNVVMTGRDGYTLLVWALLPRDSLLILAERVR